MNFRNDGELTKFLEHFPPNSLMEAFQFRLVAFVQFLWLVKDSDAYIRDLYCITPKSVSFASSLNQFSSCRGETAPVTFSRDEIIRCGVFHGAFLKPKRQEQLERISSRCDEFLRETLRRILTSKEFADHFADKDESFDNYFRDLMFGAFPSTVGATSL